jgi:hypothetical protein
MCCARSYFHQMDSFHQYSKKTLYFYSSLKILDTEDQIFLLSSNRRVLNLLIIFPMLLRMPVHQLRIPKVGEHMFQMIGHWKVPHHQGRNFPLRHVLFIRINFSINTLRTDSNLVLIFFIFFFIVSAYT